MLPLSLNFIQQFWVFIGHFYGTVSGSHSLASTGKHLAEIAQVTHVPATLHGWYPLPGCGGPIRGGGKSKPESPKGLFEKQGYLKMRSVVPSKSISDGPLEEALFFATNYIFISHNPEPGRPVEGVGWGGVGICIGSEPSKRYRVPGILSKWKSNIRFWQSL